MATVTAELEYEGRRYTVTQDDWDVTKYDDQEDMEHLIYYMWTDGNYGCDCNRMLFIAEAYDDFPKEPDDEQDGYGWFNCGNTVKLVGLTLDGKDLLAPPVHEMTTRDRLAAMGLVGL